jgi:hypothetical protein
MQIAVQFLNERARIEKHKFDEGEWSYEVASVSETDCLIRVLAADAAFLLLVSTTDRCARLRGLCHGQHD